MTLRSLLFLCFFVFSSPADMVPLVLRTAWLLLLLLKAAAFAFVGSLLILDVLLICVLSSLPSLLFAPAASGLLFVAICFKVSLMFVRVLIITVAAEELVGAFVLLFVSVVTVLELLGLEVPLWEVSPLAMAPGQMKGDNWIPLIRRTNPLIFSREASISLCWASTLFLLSIHLCAGREDTVLLTHATKISSLYSYGIVAFWRYGIINECIS